MKTMTELEKQAKDALTHPPDAGFHGDDDLFVTKGIAGTIRHRDSDLIQESNGDAIIERLTEKFGSADDTEGTVAEWYVMGVGHWAVGWVDLLVCRVLIEEDGGIVEDNITAVFREMMEIHGDLESYPLLDEDDYSARCWESTKHNVIQEAPWWADVNDENVEDVLMWFSDVGYEAGGDDQDWYSRDEIAEACDALQLISDQEDYDEWKAEQNV